MKITYQSTIFLKIQTKQLSFDLVSAISLTSPHSDAANVFLSQEVPDFHHGTTLLDDNVDGEMGVHGTHFIAESLY